jgi:large subunit ribosomal protein L16
MALMPKRIKHRKQQRGRIRGNATRGNTVAFGEFGLQSMGPGWITEGRVYIRIFPDKPVSSKPLETRMGKGKGETKDWVAVVKPGTILYEIAGVDENTAKEALRRAAMKMPVRCRMLHRRHTL